MPSYGHSARPAARIPHFLADQRGAGAVEFGIIATALILFILGLIETGRALWIHNALHYAVEEAARCASINATSCGSESQVQTFAATRSGASFATSVFTFTTAVCGNKVSASYPMTLNIPFVSYSVTLTAQSCYPT
jgi:Flp pilus assembly protein TadG